MQSFISFICLLFLQTVPLLCIDHYQLVSLEAQRQSRESIVTGMNNHGILCGTLKKGSYDYIFVEDPPERTFATRYEEMDSLSFVINNFNEIFGSVLNEQSDALWDWNEETAFKWKHPFRYFQYFNRYYLGNPSGTYSSNTYAVIWDANDLGQFIVMNKDDSDILYDESKPTSLWIYDQNAFHKIENPQLEGACKINNYSKILGWFHTGSTAEQNRKRYLSIHDFKEGTIQVLNLEGKNPLGQDINDLSQVVGAIEHPESDAVIGFCTDSFGEIKYFSHFYPLAINNNGQMIGEFIQGKKKGKPALFFDGALYDLMDLTSLQDDKGNTWDSLDSLVKINDKGWIIGNGTLHGKQHGFLLKPIKSGE